MLPQKYCSSEFTFGKKLVTKKPLKDFFSVTVKSIENHSPTCYFLVQLSALLQAQSSRTPQVDFDGR